MGLCSDCKHWDRTQGDDFGVCRIITLAPQGMLQNSVYINGYYETLDPSDPLDAEEIAERRVFREVRKAAVTAYDTCGVKLACQADFGCVLFEAKPA